MRPALLALPLIAVTAAHAAEPAGVRVGSHPGFGRIVFDLPNPSSFQLAEHGSRVVITFAAGGTIGMPDAAPKNVISILGGEGSATLTLVPGARIRSAQMGNRVVIDVLDPVSRSHPTPAPAAPAPQAAAPVAPAVSTAASVAPSAGNSRSQPEATAKQEPVAPPKSEAAAAPKTEPAAAPKPEPAAAPRAEPVEAPSRPASDPSPQPPRTPAGEVVLASVEPPAPPPAPVSAASPLRVAAASDVGVAAFRRGNLGVVVFDGHVAIDPAQLEAAGLAKATVQDAGAGTVLAVPLGPDAGLTLAREQAGWIVRSGTAELPEAEQGAVPDGIGFKMASPGRVLTVRDPYTGQTLLVGTSRNGGAKGGAVRKVRRAPGYVLLPTWLGLAFEPTSDQVNLRASLAGFTLVTPDASSPGKVAAEMVENGLGLPNAPVPVLLRHLNAEIASAAAAPARARGHDRVAAARTMLSLGMANEAQALLSLAAEEDPAVAADSAVSVLAGAAAVLAGRPNEAASLDSAAGAANPDIQLWRGLRDVALGKPSDTLGRGLRETLAYPAAVRSRMLPPVYEAAVRSGQPISKPEQFAGKPGLDFARALQSERAGKLDEALSGYDAVVRGRDLSDSVRAGIAGTELRLTQHQLTAADAADKFERLALRWRGDGRELATRLRAAELRVQAGQWRQALEDLRDTEALFPDAAAEIGSRKAGVFQAMTEDAAKVSPLDMVTVVGDFADCIPKGPEGDAVAALLADKLIALDLPSRAVPVLERLLNSAPSPRAKAHFGLALAQLQLELGQPAKAQAALEPLDERDLPADRAEARTLLLARARAGQNDAAGAIQLLSRLSSPPAYELRAKLAAASGDWAGSLQALTDLASKVVPPEGELTDSQQDIVLRRAVAAVQAGNTDAVREMRPIAQRLTGPRAEQFRVLTASAVRSTDDLQRSAGELAMVRSFAARPETAPAR